MAISCDICGKRLLLSSVMEVSVRYFEGGKLAVRDLTVCDKCLDLSSVLHIYTYTSPENDLNENPSQEDSQSSQPELTEEQKAKAEHVHHKNALSDLEASAFYDTVIPQTPSGLSPRVEAFVRECEEDGKAPGIRGRLEAALDSQLRPVRELMTLSGVSQYAQAVRVLNRMAEDGLIVKDSTVVNGSRIALFSTKEAD